MRKKMGAFTIVLLIWLTLYVGFLCLNIVAAVIGYDTVRAVELALLCLVTILYALSIAGIVTHYYGGGAASRLRWGPLCGIAGAAVYLGLTVVAAVYDPSTLWAWLYVFVLSTGIPSYVEYLKEGAPVATARVTQSVLSRRLSSALARHVQHIEVSIDQVRRRVRRDLTLLTVATAMLPVGVSAILAFAILLAGAHIIDLNLQDPRLQQSITASVCALFSVLFLIIAVMFSSLVKKAHFVILSVNHSDAGLESDAAAERRTLEKDAHRRLFIFLFVWAIPILYSLDAASMNPDKVGAALFTSSLVAQAAFLLSALACFLLGYRVLTQRSVAAIALDAPALHGLFDASIGVLPTKVRAGESHSVMMDFNIAAAGDMMSSTGDPPTFNADLPRAHYEVELQAAGATVDGEKRCAILDAPATLKGIWSCSFPTVGTQRLHLLLHSVRSARARTARDTLIREPIFAYTHAVHVDRTASSENVISVIGVMVTAASVLVNLRLFIHF
jgi:hypothetical protein